MAYAAPKADAKTKPEPAASAKAPDKAKPADAAKPDAKDKSAQPTLSVEKKASYIYWFTYKDADGAAQATLPQRFKGKSTKLDLSALGEKFANARLFVMNKATGNLAISDYPPKDTKDVDLRLDDFHYVRSVRLRVISEDGKPIESAIAHLKDGDDTAMSAIVTPADEGVASFSNVAAGECSITVDAEGVKKTADSDFEIPDKRDTPYYEKNVTVVGDVHTLPIKPKAREAAAKQEQSGGGLSAILMTIASFIVLMIVIGVIVIVLKAKGITGKTALQGLGVELPGQPGGQTIPGVPAGPAVDPNVCPFCGQRKDASGQCACSVIPGAAPVGGAMATSPNGPRLVGFQGVYAGHIFEITGPSMVMGRESENPIPLPNDGTASRRHATISQSNGGCSIRDEGSSNGTFVNGAKITEQQLSPGDEVQVGGTKFRFEV